MNSKPTPSENRVDTSQFKRLFSLVRPYRGILAVALVAITLGSVLGLAGPYTLQFLIDAVFRDSDRELLNRITLLLIGIFAGQSVIYFVRGYLLAYIGERVMADLRLKLFAHLQRLSLSFFNERRTGEIVSRLTNDVATIRSVVTSDISTALSQVLSFFGALALIIITDWRLTLFMFALVPLVMLVGIVFGRRLRKLSENVQDQLADATTVAEEAIGGIRVVKSFAREEFEVNRYSRSIQETVRLALLRIRLSSVFGPLISFLGFGAVVSIFWYGGNEVLAGRLTAGQLFMFLVLTMTIAGSIGQFSGLWTGLQEAVGATGRIFEILDRETDIRESPHPVWPAEIEGKITFIDVDFAYPDRAERSVLHGINLEIAAGEVLALVGPSGAGKTTLVNLIGRFYDPTAGSITLDGVDLRELALKRLREQVGVVPQDTLLFGGTVRENILYGRLDASDEDVVAAAEAANAHDFIMEIDEGYDAVVGERGVKLSGGQRQRIAIARAQLKNPRILLLDEATSSLDSESEGLVQQALERLMKGRTSIVIAHRLSTVQDADRIAVLDEGRIVEIGPHAELLALDGVYARLHGLQFRDPAPAAGETEPVAEGGDPPDPRARRAGLFSRILDP